MNINLNRSALLAPENRSFLIINVLFMPAMINILIACALANVLFPPGAEISLWGPSSMVIDLLISSFMASLITGLIGFYSTLALCNKGLLMPSDSRHSATQSKACSRQPWLSNLLAALFALGITSVVLSVFVLSYDQATITWLSFLWIKSVQAMLVSVYASLIATHLAIRYYQNRSPQEIDTACD